MEDPERPKCLCPFEGPDTEITKQYPFLTVAEAAAVASGYSPCCTYWRNSKDFINIYQNQIEEMDLWEQELYREVACGKLQSIRDRLDPKRRLIPRRALDEWLANHKRNKSAEEPVSDSAETLLARRANAIVIVIAEQRYDAQSMTTSQKKALRKGVAKHFPDLCFTKSTFDKAWVEGGRLGLFAIKDKQKYMKTSVFQKSQPKKV